MATEAAVAMNRMRRAVLAFRSAQTNLLNAHRRMNSRTRAEADTYWAGPGRQVKADMRAAAAELDAAFEGLSGARLGVDTADLQTVAEAQRYLAAAGSSSPPRMLS
jgi:hypothetical protein